MQNTTLAFACHEKNSTNSHKHTRSDQDSVING